ncbi:hypothetical protein CBOM_01689 [Ceraceosorus bombacis]|uniref:Uncharacterized protein n=1 Tax=Ceraceosorus bombacis TaxID=401625 RepID=A0A0P1BEE7_9BASI|nr:hypothetical protein CBOM_01689 [Ceraceosorus bombacis]
MRASPISFLLSALLLCLAAVGVQAATCDNKCRERGLAAYIKAIVSHKKEDADAIPLKDPFARFESFNGLGPFQTAASAAELRRTTQLGASTLAYKSSEIKFTHYNNQTVRGEYVLSIGLLSGVVPITTTATTTYANFDGKNIQRIDIYTQSPAPK